MRSNLSFLLLLGLLLPLGGAHAQTVPAIDPSLDTPIDLIFEEPASVLDIYRALGQAWGINFLFDPKLRDQEISIVLRDVSPSEGLDNVLRAVGHFYSVVDAKTLLIADDTPQNRRTHEHQVIQRFYLENSAVKDTMTMVRSLIGAKHVAAMEATNSIVIRDTADKIGIVERLLQNNDRPQAEVVVELDLLAIDSQKLRQLALKPAAEAAGAEDGLPPRLRTGEIDRLRSQASVQRLAQPRLNVVGGSRGKVQLTDRLPLPASLADARAEGVGAVVYHEVGVELAVEPWVHSADEVSLKLELGIDTLTDWLTGSQGEAQPVFGRRNLEASARLRNGETYLLTGLMIAPEPADGKKSTLRFGRFLNQAGNGREVVLALTPRIVRGPGIGGDALAPLWTGTEANISIHGGSRRTASPIAGPFDRQATGGATNR